MKNENNTHPLAHLTKKHIPIPESQPLEFYDIMGEPHELWATLTKKKEIEVIVTNENDEVVFKELTTDIAWDELVYFAKQILSCNEHIERMKQIKEQECFSNNQRETNISKFCVGDSVYIIDPDTGEKCYFTIQKIQKIDEIFYCYINDSNCINQCFLYPEDALKIKEQE